MILIMNLVILLSTQLWQCLVAIFVLLACFQNLALLVADRPRDGEYFTADTCVTVTYLIQSLPAATCSLTNTKRIISRVASKWTSR
jgi:hypothetical protein